MRLRSRGLARQIMRLAFETAQVDSPGLPLTDSQEIAESRGERFEEPHERRVFGVIRFRPGNPSAWASLKTIERGLRFLKVSGAGFGNFCLTQAFSLTICAGR